MLTIVVYHYVRDLPNTAYPNIKGRLTADFEGQLEYLQRYYTLVDIRDVVRATRNETSLPANACLLTFDDGLIDHYETVFPRLLAQGLTGSFYVPGAPVLEQRVLDVQKIHFILAVEPDAGRLKDQIFAALDRFRGSWPLPPNAELYARYGQAGYFDGPEVMFIKRVLQVGLPAEIRHRITGQLFARTVTEDEASFAQGLYMSLPMLQEMARAGMTIGGHSYSHDWLGMMDCQQQEAEIRASRALVEQVYARAAGDWIMSYPYGSYNSDTLDLVRAYNGALGLTARIALADLSRPLELDRLDTNDLPHAGNTLPNQWTQVVQG